MLSGSGGTTQVPGSSATDPRQGTNESARPVPANDEGGQFVAAMLASTEDVWTALFSEQGQRYAAPKLRLFTGGVQSDCGYNSSAVGPFYCPPDQKVYIDLGFYDQLAQMGGAGDFAQAYVIGHEVGHHIQNLLGTSERVQQMSRGLDESGRNQLGVRMELQADCYAGVWAHHANQAHQVLEPGDVEEGLAAAQAIGDDTLQRNAGRQISPDSFTHGSSAQRMQWLRRGLSIGTVAACDTFASP